MADLKYTKEHEWVQIEGDVATIGITEYAQEALGDLVYVELPEVGDSFEKGDDFAVVESVKVASEIYTPFAGEIVEVNEALSDKPELLKESLEEGWIAKIKLADPSDLSDLIEKSEYDSFIADLD